MAVADRENRILIPADTDFGELLATAPIIAPSLIILRRTDRRPDSRASIILANLGQVADDLETGALVVTGESGIRSRRLPVKPAD